MNSENILVVDTETSIYNKGNPFDPRNFLVSYVTIFNNSVSFKYYTDPDFKSTILGLIRLCSMVCGFNVKFDIHWLSRLGIDVPVDVKIWDCQIGEFINSGQTLPYDSLDAACERYGLPRKPDRIKQYWEVGVSTENIPVKELEEYNIHDVESTKGLYEIQQQLLSEKQKKLVLLEGDDLRTLQSAEYAGIKFNKDAASRLVLEQSKRMAAIRDRLYSYLPADCAPYFNWNSGDDLSALLYGGKITFKYATPREGIYKSGAKKGQSYTSNTWHTIDGDFPQRFKPLEKSEVKKTRDDPDATTRIYQTDQPTLQQLKTKNKEDNELLAILKTLSDETKVGEMAQSLIDKSVEMHWQDNYIHGQFNQTVARTGRLSSSAPNLQNQPPEIDKLLVSRYD